MFGSLDDINEMDVCAFTHNSYSSTRIKGCINGMRQIIINPWWVFGTYNMNIFIILFYFFSYFVFNGQIMVLS